LKGHNLPCSQTDLAQYFTHSGKLGLHSHTKMDSPDIAGVVLSGYCLSKARDLPSILMTSLASKHCYPNFDLVEKKLSGMPSGLRGLNTGYSQLQAIAPYSDVLLNIPSLVLEYILILEDKLEIKQLLHFDDMVRLCFPTMSVGIGADDNRIMNDLVQWGKHNSSLGRFYGALPSRSCPIWSTLRMAPTRSRIRGSRRTLGLCP
jgi:hypothetical protein